MPTLKSNTIRRPWQAERIAQAGRKNPNRDVYGTNRWTKLARRHKMANPVCVECLSKGIVSPAEVTDHKRSINQGGDPFAWDNLQSLCKTCHNSKSGKEAWINKSEDGK